MKISSLTHTQGEWKFVTYGFCFGEAEIVSLRDLYNKKCQTSSCMYQTGVTLDINPDGKGLCDFHRHSDRLSFLAWLEVARVSLCRCWLGAEWSPESSTRITKHGQQLWLLNFLFTFHLFLLFKYVALRTCPFEQGQWHGWKWCRLWGVFLLTSSLKYWVKIPEGTFGVTSHLKKNVLFFSECPFLHWSFAQYFGK